MSRVATAAFQPEFCPNPRCFHHRMATSWRFKKKGFFRTSVTAKRVQRYLCLHCGRSFSDQTFHPSYWLRRGDILEVVFQRILSCSGYRQIARELHVSPTTVLRHVERLGRHCLLFHEQRRPREPNEAVAIDGLETFEYSQYYPMHLNTAVGAVSHFAYSFTDSELRRKGRMTAAQKARRTYLEARHGRPDPRAVERGIAELLEIVVPIGGSQEIRSDEHPAYRRAIRGLPHRRLKHQVTSSKQARTTGNPLFPSNLLDLLIRHSSANHKRETIAFSKRRQSAVYRLAVLWVWRNYMKSFSERKQDQTPAERLGITDRRLTVKDVLQARLFSSRIPLPERWQRYYRQEIPTRSIPEIRRHRLRYAF